MAHRDRDKREIERIHIEPLDDGTFLMRFNFKHKNGESFMMNEKTYSYQNINSLVSDLRKDFSSKKTEKKDGLNEELSKSAYKNKEE